MIIGNEHGAATTQVDEMVTELARLSRLAYNIWIRHVVREALGPVRESVASDLSYKGPESRWTMHWQATVVKVEGEDGQGAEDELRLPARLSNAVFSMLFQVAEELQRIGTDGASGGAVRPGRLLIHDLGMAFVKIYADAIVEGRGDALDAALVQQVFDLRLVGAILGLDRPDKTMPETALFSDTVDKLQNELDPIDWTFQAPLLETAVSDAAERFCVIFGCFRSSVSRSAKGASALSASQRRGYGLIPLAPVTARFALLPIGSLNAADALAMGGELSAKGNPRADTTVDATTDSKNPARASERLGNLGKMGMGFVESVGSKWAGGGLGGGLLRGLSDNITRSESRR